MSENVKETVSEKEQSQQIESKVGDLQQGEKTRITIVENEDGSIAIGAHSTEKLDTFKLVGLIEAAKVDMLSSQKQGSDQSQVVEIVLDDLDFEMDKMGLLSKENRKVGDIIPMPTSLVELREYSRSAYLSTKPKKDLSKEVDLSKSVLKN